MPRSVRLSALLLVALSTTALGQDPPAAATAQAPQKKFVTPEAAKSWEMLAGARMSNDGRWFAYGVALVDGDGRLVIRNVDGPEKATVPFGSNAQFSDDSKWVAYTIGLPKAEIDKLREQKKMVEMKLGLRNLENGQERVVESVQSWTWLKGGKYLLAHRYRGDGKTKGGSDFVLLTVGSESLLTVGNVSSFLPNEDGTLVALRIESDSGEGGVQVLDPATQVLRTVHWSKGKYPSLAWAEKKEAMAFLVGHPDEKKEGDRHEVVVATDLSAIKPTLKVFDPAGFSEFPKDFRIVEFGGLEINEDGSSVAFGIKAWEDKKKPSGKPEDKPTVDIWHYKDVEVMPYQAKMVEIAKRENWLCVWRTEKNLFYQIGNERWTDVSLSPDHKYALVADETAYETPVVVGGLTYADYYVVDIDASVKEKVLEKRQYGPMPSPDGRYLAYYKQKNWWLYDCAKRTHTNLTEKVKTDWSDQDNDLTISEKPAAGFPYWLEDDKGVVLYDNYDAYLVRTDTLSVDRLTDGAKDRIVLRLVDITQDDKRVGLGDTMFFTMFDEVDKLGGYLRRESNGAAKPLMFEKAVFSGLVKAKDADRVYVTMQTPEQPPTVLVSNEVFSQAKPITTINAQQKDFYWGKTELVHFKNKAGKDLQGVLMYPAGYEEGKSYPMVTYIYEKLSQSAFQYKMPSDSATYNPQLLVQSGYFVFMPDIVYRERNPGLSALDCVTSGVNAVIKMNVGVDPKKLGLMGHSWGGYQTAFIVTQTNMFAAANAGAPLTELRSMYNSFYWNAGITDQVIFESSQGRMAVPWWEDPKSYADNNPLDHAHKIQTPILMEQGDQDGAVDFHQGQQLYNTLRRMGKPIVFLVYNGENHNNARRPNQVDYAARQRHFFDVYLKGAKPEKWLSDGIPFLKKGG